MHCSSWNPLAGKGSYLSYHIHFDDTPPHATHLGIAKIGCFVACCPNIEAADFEAV